MKKRFYWCAVFIASAIAVSDLIFYFYIYGLSLHSGTGIAARVTMDLPMALGFWICSNFSRYLGIPWFALSVASVLWPLIAGQPVVWSLGLIWVGAFGLLSAIGFCLMITKRFHTEFFERRAEQPSYVNTLRKVFWIAIAVAAAVATFIDILHLASA